MIYRPFLIVPLLLLALLLPACTTTDYQLVVDDEGRKVAEFVTLNSGASPSMSIALVAEAGEDGATLAYIASGDSGLQQLAPYGTAGGLAAYGYYLGHGVKHADPDVYHGGDTNVTNKQGQAQGQQQKQKAKAYQHQDQRQRGRVGGPPHKPD